MKAKKLTAAVLALTVCAGLLSGCQKNETANEDSRFRLCDKIEDGVILHAWCWSFNTIKESMADIASAGYTAVQTSPANAVIEGGDGGMQLMGKGKWYYQYQPTDWTIGNYQLGTEEEFAAMCEEADKYDVKIIVDVVPNHTAADTGAVSRDLIDAVGGIDHLYHRNYTKNITNYSSRTECTCYSLSGLPDVNTENPEFQKYFISYLNRLIAYGADGFRYDTAKHIALPDDPKDSETYENNFWERVTTDISRAGSIFNYGEVLQGDNDRIGDYLTAIGHVTASDYGKRLRALLLGGLISYGMLSDFGVEGSDKVVTWVESHDNYTDGTSLRLTDEQIVLGWAIIAANGGGTPLFFDRPYGADPADQWGEMNRIGAAGSPLYKDDTVKAVNRFRNAMVGEATKLSNLNDNTVLMIARGKKGAVIVNAGSADVTVNADVKLAKGTYTDRTGKNGTFTVENGKLGGIVAAGSVAVLYNDGYADIPELPGVDIETESFTFADAPLNIRLRLNGADSGKYIFGGMEYDFKDGDVASLHFTDKNDTLTLTAQSSDGLTTTMTYYFTGQQIVAEGSEIGFRKPTDWGSDIFAYVYDETGRKLEKNAAWPGVLMTLDLDGTYKYTTDRDWSGALVIFSDGEKQYPAAMEPGLTLRAGMTYSVPDN